MASQVTTYRSEAFSYLDYHTDAIWDTADALGISATAIAGAMAEERDAYARNADNQRTIDSWVDEELKTHSDVALDYAQARFFGVDESTWWLVMDRGRCATIHLVCSVSIRSHSSRCTRPRRAAR